MFTRNRATLEDRKAYVEQLKGPCAPTRLSEGRRGYQVEYRHVRAGLVEQAFGRAGMGQLVTEKAMSEAAELRVEKEGPASAGLGERSVRNVISGAIVLVNVVQQRQR